MNGVQVARRSLPLTWGQIAASLTRDYGEANASKTVEYLRDREGLLNSLNQCGDLARASLKIDGGLYAMEPEGVRTHQD